MNNRALTLSILMGFVAAMFVNSYVNSLEEEANKKYGTKVIAVIAKRDIKEMDTILETMLDFKVVPKTFLEPAAVSLEAREGDDAEKEKIRTLKGLTGTVALVSIKAGEQLTYSKINEPSLRTGLSPQIAPGRRALAVPVNEITGVSKLLKPGDRVDLIAVMDFGGGKENKIAKTVLQDVVILSIGRYVTNNAARIMESESSGSRVRVKSLTEDFGFTTVTLEVDPAQAQTLALVMSSGENALTLSLRNNEDTDRANFAGSILSDVLGPDAGKVKIGQAARK